jgi:nucleoside-diphosphate-sugar epimerase
MKVVGILGCGWLGIPLGVNLQKKNWQVKASRKSDEGIALLRKNRLEEYKIEITSQNIIGNIDFFKELSCLIISLPPNRKSQSNNYVQKISLLLKKIKPLGVKKIIFLSSISVYGSIDGVYDETITPRPESHSAKALLSCEQEVLDYAASSVIVRLGGLIGDNRNPIFQLQGKLIPNPEGVINFITQRDAIKGIEAILKLPIEKGGIFNLVSPHHPKRKEYYKYVSKKHALPSPKFQEDKFVHRVINSDAILRETTFEFKDDNLLI